MSDYTVAVVGATGLVGQTMLQVLEQRRFPVRELRAVASERSLGVELQSGGQSCPVTTLHDKVFDDVHIALFSAGGAVSREWAPLAVQRGAVVIDNSSAWRMDDAVPLIVPEVNAADLADASPRIIANPNCSTIQLVVALRPLRDRWGLKRIFVSTYQAVSGAGQKGLDQYDAELRDEENGEAAFPHRITDNVLPQIGSFLDSGYSVEERKMVDESRKIFGLPDLPVAVTCVRVPVRNAHSEAVHVELEQDYDLAELRGVLAASPGVVLLDDAQGNVYPQAYDASGSDSVFVGRLRRDEALVNGLAMWIVSDNVRKGAATNAVQIAELWRRLKEE
jgi:aspartate-semialdehyde dehydrogenase